MRKVLNIEHLAGPLIIKELPDKLKNSGIIVGN